MRKSDVVGRFVGWLWVTEGVACPRESCLTRRRSPSGGVSAIRCALREGGLAARNAHLGYKDKEREEGEKERKRNMTWKL